MSVPGPAAAETTAATGAAAAPDDAASRDTAAKLAALLRHLFLYDRGSMLRVLEESGLSTTQVKVLLEIGGIGGETEPRHVSDLAELFGVSVPAMSRAVEALVSDGLATRVEDPDDRRVRRVAVTGAGRELVDRLAVVRRDGMEAFAQGLDAKQRRMLDAAIDALMDREDIAKAYEHLKEVRTA